MKYTKKYFGRAFLAIALLSNVACGNSDSPVIPASASIPQFSVETVASNLEIVWSIVFTPDGRIFFTERPGRVRGIENGQLRSVPFFTVPDV